MGRTFSRTNLDLGRVAEVPSFHGIGRKFGGHPGPFRSSMFLEALRRRLTHGELRSLFRGRWRHAGTPVRGVASASPSKRHRAHASRRALDRSEYLRLRFPKRAARSDAYTAAEGKPRREAKESERKRKDTEDNRREPNGTEGNRIEPKGIEGTRRALKGSKERRREAKGH